MLTQHCSAAQSKKQVVHLFICLLHLENKMEKVDSFWQNRYLQRLLLLLKWWFLLRDGNVLLHSSSPVWEHFTAQKYIFSQFQDVGQKTTFQTLKKAEKISCDTPFSNSKQGAEDFSHFPGKISACSSSWFFCMVLIAQSSGSSSRITTDLKYRPGFTTLLVIELVSDQNP